MSVLSKPNQTSSVLKLLEGAKNGLAKLSPRQRTVMAYLVLGMTNREIAHHLGKGEGTIKIHVQNICRKIGVRNRTRAIIAALLLGDYKPDMTMLLQ